jgi:hypothetical protein
MSDELLSAFCSICKTIFEEPRQAVDGGYPAIEAHYKLAHTKASFELGVERKCSLCCFLFATRSDICRPEYEDVDILWDGWDDLGSLDDMQLRYAFSTYG